MMQGDRDRAQGYAVGSVSGPILDPDRRSNESKGAENLVFQEALVGEVQLHLAIGEDDESRRSDGRLRHIVDPHLLAGGNRGALEIHMLEEAVHLAGSDAPAALDSNFFQCREYFLGAFSG